jgi:hypothetical protein
MGTPPLHHSASKLFWTQLRLGAPFAVALAAMMSITASAAPGIAAPARSGMDGKLFAGSSGSSFQISQLESFPRRERGEQQAGTLTELELMWAEAAWSYFAGMTSETTGLVPSRTGISHASMWTVGDHIAALVAARQIELIDAVEFDRRFTTVLGFLNSMPLAFNTLPNQTYSIETGAPLGADFEPGMTGWSGVDLGRLLIWLRIVAVEYPFYEIYIRNTVSRFNVCDVVDEQGGLLAAHSTEVGQKLQPEGHRGYDAYAVEGYRAWGLDMPAVAIDVPNYRLEIYGEWFQVDETPIRIPPLMTAPPSYLGIEFGFNGLALNQGDELFDGVRTAEELVVTMHTVQEERYRDTGILTARTDYRRGAEPFALYDTVITNGYPWSTVDANGTAYPRLSLLSTRAAFAMSTLLESEYAETLLQAVTPLYSENGWGEGRYELSGAHERTRTSATNAFILEALAYRQDGPLFPASARSEVLGPSVTNAAQDMCQLPFTVVKDRPAQD